MQCREAYAQIARALQRWETGQRHVVKTTEFVTPEGIRDYRKTAAVRRECFHRPYPAATGVVCEGLLAAGRARSGRGGRGDERRMSTYITDEVKSWIGREATYTAPEELGRGSIRYFAMALGDDNPLFSDADYSATHETPRIDRAADVGLRDQSNFPATAR